MSTYENNYKSGHPALGLVLGILGIAVALLLAFFTGAIGAGIAIILGIAAILLGISARRKSNKGMGAIVTGALAIILALVLMTTVTSLFTEMRNKAKELGTAPLVAEYMDKPYLGFLGMAMNLPDDEGTAEEFTKQLTDIMNQLAGVTTETTPEVIPEATANP